ncbi:hypothetical protein L1987_54621 [Smallanthus sonchifolius]|uniref:Uncharacterized protein n=1 Tax=Smallanthus sonchifolius TaxID=185202 RepID=A0ACB9E7H9_9ASTR|nr:hypothetical protein L1987_54621 [Smallanthus sonchifolius]
MACQDARRGLLIFGECAGVSQSFSARATLVNSWIINEHNSWNTSLPRIPTYHHPYCSRMGRNCFKSLPFEEAIEHYLQSSNQLFAGKEASGAENSAPDTRDNPAQMATGAKDKSENKLENEDEMDATDEGTQ